MGLTLALRMKDNISQVTAKLESLFVFSLSSYTLGKLKNRNYLPLLFLIYLTKIFYLDVS